MPQLESRPTLPPLPRSVQDIADVIGRDLALHLIAHLPRRYSKGHPAGQPNLYVPKMLSVDHVLVRVIGIDAAQKLVAAFGGENLYPAICTDTDRAPRDAEILRFLEREVLNRGHRAMVRHLPAPCAPYPQESGPRARRSYRQLTGAYATTQALTVA